MQEAWRNWVFFSPKPSTNPASFGACRLKEISLLSTRHNSQRWSRLGNQTPLLRNLRLRHSNNLRSLCVLVLTQVNMKAS